MAMKGVFFRSVVVCTSRGQIRVPSHGELAFAVCAGTAILAVMCVIISRLLGSGALVFGSALHRLCRAVIPDLNNLSCWTPQSCVS